MKKSIIILLSVMALALAFSGCGGSAGSVDSSTPVEDVLSETASSVSTDTVRGLQTLPDVPAIPE